MSIQSTRHLRFKGALCILFFLTVTPFLLSHSSSDEAESRLSTNPLHAMRIGRSYLDAATLILTRMKTEALKSDSPQKQYEIFIDLLDKHLQKAHALNPNFGYLTTVNLMKEHIKSLDPKETPLEKYLQNSPLKSIMAAACVTLKKDASPQE
jgi:hypothetical protein